MASNYFCILNYCYKLYLLKPIAASGTDQLTGKFRPAHYVVSEIKGNIESGVNDNRNVDLTKGELKNGDKTLYISKKLPIGSFVYIENSMSEDGVGEVFEITRESKFTPFMNRMIGVMRYTYDLNKTTTISPLEFDQFLKTGKGYGLYEFDTSMNF